MTRTVWIALVVILAVIAVFLFDTIRDMGAFREVSIQHPGNCRRVAGVPGPEDITIDPAGETAYVSSDDRRAKMAGREVAGAIYAYDLDAGSPEPVNLFPDASQSFHPHGIGLYADGEGAPLLFVVNHPGESLFGQREHEGPRHTVEIFEIAGDQLVHRRTMSGPELVSPNDVIPVGRDRFYVTNDHGSEPGLWRTLEDYLRLPWSNVLYYDGDTFTEAADGLTYANGINLSPDGETLYVMQVTDNTVRRYERDPQTGELSGGDEFGVGFGGDNIEVAPSGELWIGGHPRLLEFVEHAENPAVRAPSQVVRVSFDGGEPRVETVFMDDGSLIAGSSVGTRRGRDLLVGAVFDDHFVHCRLPEEGS